MQLFITGKLLSHAAHLDTKLHYRKPRRWETADRKNDEICATRERAKDLESFYWRS